MSRRNGTSLRRTSLRSSLSHCNTPGLIRELLRHLLTQIDRQKALRQLDRVELSPQSLQHLLPLPVACQTPTRRAADAVLAVELDVQRVEGVAAGGEGDADGVVIVGLRVVGVDVGGGVLGLVEFEADLREVVELGDGVAGDLGGDAALQNAVEEGVDVGFFGEVDEGFGVVGCLDCLSGDGS